MLKLQNGMTKQRLTFVVRCIVGGAIEKLQDNMPDVIDVSERQRLTGGSATDLSGYETGIIAQAIGSVSIVLAQSLGDGIGDTDADEMLGGFWNVCERFVKSNWECYGKVCRDRYERLKKKGSFNYKDLYLDYPDDHKIAQDCVDRLFAYYEQESLSG